MSQALLVRLTMHISSWNSSPARWPHSPPYWAEFLLGLSGYLHMFKGVYSFLYKAHKYIPGEFKSLSSPVIGCWSSDWLDHRAPHHTGPLRSFQYCWVSQRLGSTLPEAGRGTHWLDYEPQICASFRFRTRQPLQSTAFPHFSPCIFPTVSMCFKKKKKSKSFVICLPLKSHNVL